MTYFFPTGNNAAYAFKNFTNNSGIPLYLILSIGDVNIAQSNKCGYFSSTSAPMAPPMECAYKIIFLSFSVSFFTMSFTKPAKSLTYSSKLLTYTFDKSSTSLSDLPCPLCSGIYTEYPLHKK